MAIHGFGDLMGHDLTNKNQHMFTFNSEFHFMEIVKNPDMKTKYVYSDDFLNNENDKPIDIENLNITDCYKPDKPLFIICTIQRRLNHFKIICLFSTLFTIYLR
jgi:hypothetical protein